MLALDMVHDISNGLEDFAAVSQPALVPFRRKAGFLWSGIFIAGVCALWVCRLFKSSGSLLDDSWWPGRAEEYALKPLESAVSESKAHVSSAVLVRTMSWRRRSIADTTALASPR
jgi:hypothetical protein